MARRSTRRDRGARVAQSLAAIGEVTGHGIGDDLLDHIFNRFCIGSERAWSRGEPRRTRLRRGRSRRHAGCEATVACATPGCTPRRHGENSDTAKMSCIRRSAGSPRVTWCASSTRSAAWVASRTSQASVPHAERGRSPAVWSPRPSAANALLKRWLVLAAATPNIQRVAGVNHVRLDAAGSAGDRARGRPRAVVPRRGRHARHVPERSHAHGERQIEGGRVGGMRRELSECLGELGLTRGGSRPARRPGSTAIRSAKRASATLATIPAAVLADGHLDVEWCRHFTRTTRERDDPAQSRALAALLGQISGTGPRYCPSLEDKVVKFRNATRTRFLEPEDATVIESA